MNSVVDGLRQTPKGQLVYTREIEGRELKDLLHKCASVPALSSPHNEMTPPHPRLSVSLGLCCNEEEEEEEEITQTDLDDGPHSKEGNEPEEKGEQDSLERESPSPHGDASAKAPKSPHVTSPRSPHVTSPRSPHVTSPRSPHVTSSKSPSVTSPKSPSVTSPKSPCVTSPKSPCVTSPKSPLVTSPKSPRVKWSLDSSGDSQSRLAESSVGKEGEGEEVTCDDLVLSFTEKLKAVSNVEEGYDNRSKEQMEKKHQEFLSHQLNLDSWRSEVNSLVKQRHRQDMSQLHSAMEKEQQAKRPAIQQAVQKVKDNHQHCSQRQDARLKHVEQLGQQLMEEKARREQALDQKLQEVRSTAQKITAIKSTLVAALDQCPHKQHLLEVADKTKLLVRRLSEQGEVLASSLTRTGPLDEVLSKLKQFHEQSMNALDFVHNLTAEAERKAKAAAAEAEKQKQQAAAAAAQSLQTPQMLPPAQGAQALSTPQTMAAGEDVALLAVAKEYEHNAKLFSQTEAALDPFISNQQMKKTRFDLQRAVNTPVNAISPVSAAHLRDKLQRLRSLLRGERVEVQGKQVASNVVPEGALFCTNLTAKMIVRKADEQVSSSHESAFAIAAVAVGLWKEFPDVGQLVMAHLQNLCPYILPFSPPRLPNQSSEDYHRSLGYRIVDGNIEQQDKFLKRMSGILRLYAAILVTSPPQGPGQGHPHGLEHAWVWLTRSMTLQPNPDITATAIYDMLQVTGAFLLRAYRVQFVKLLYFLFKVFLPKLKDVAAGSGPVIRLETFLETTMKNNASIPDPEGFLPPRFWN